MVIGWSGPGIAPPGKGFVTVLSGRDPGDMPSKLRWQANDPSAWPFLSIAGFDLKTARTLFQKPA